jgi:hypothetical protein
MFLETGCPEGSTCGSLAGYCSSLESSSQTETVSSQTLTTSPVTQIETELSTTTGNCAPTAVRRALEPRQRPLPNYCSTVCNIASQEEMVVLNIKSVVGETDELIASMCKGKRLRPPISIRKCFANRTRHTSETAGRPDCSWIK